MSELSACICVLSVDDVGVDNNHLNHREKHFSPPTDRSASVLVIGHPLVEAINS